jgi:hypothetical protein
MYEVSLWAIVSVEREAGKKKKHLKIPARTTILIPSM